MTGIAPGRADTEGATVSARFVVRATEGYTADLPGLRRRLLPMNSSMIVTDVIDPSIWAQLGWAGTETLADGLHAYTYSQRTADGRIAIGGRGVPYRFGSRTDREGPVPPATVAALRARLEGLFPALRGVGVTRAWHGVLGVARDWCPTVGLDRASGLGFAGGYTGDGVAASNLAGRTLRDLVRCATWAPAASTRSTGSPTTRTSRTGGDREWPRWRIASRGAEAGAGALV